MANCAKYASKWSKIILFGDSITQKSFSPDGCWGSCLADFLIRRFDVVPRGFSGYTTRGCKLILPHFLNGENAKEVAAITIFLGANDCVDAEKQPLQHVPLEEYVQNLKDMAEYCLSVGLKRNEIIFITPPALDEPGRAIYCKENDKPEGVRTNKVAGMYAAACCKVAEELGTPLVDLHTEMMKNENFATYLCDGLHLSQAGSILLFDLLQPIISQLTSDIPDMKYPDFDDLNNTSPETLRQSFKDQGWL